MDERELSPEGGDGIGLWVALGCGGALLVGLCLVPPAFFLLSWEEEDEPVAAAPDPALEPAPDPLAPPWPDPAPPGPGPAMPPPPSPGVTSARTVTVRFTQSTLDAVRVGSTCTFPVTQHTRDDGTFWCRAEIQCGGRTLYGGGSAGYFDCTLYEQPQRHVVGQDLNTTSGDRDPAMRLDTLRTELELRDDASGALGAFSARATVTDVR